MNVAGIVYPYNAIGPTINEMKRIAQINIAKNNVPFLFHIAYVNVLNGIAKL